MQLKITIKMDNSAFSGGCDYADCSECTRILREIADKLDGMDMIRAGLLSPLLDVNGNKVGEAKVTR